MVSSLVQSLSLAALFASPASLAFTPPPAARGGASGRRAAHRPLYSDPAGEDARASTHQEAPPPSNANGHGGSRRRVPYTALPSVPPPQLAGAGDHTAGAPRSSEFHGLAPRPCAPARRARLDAEARARCLYVPAGSREYWELKDEMERLEGAVREAREAGGNEGAVAGLEEELRVARARDPEHVYRVVGDAARDAEQWGSSPEQQERYAEESRQAKRLLPQFNLEGLWVGKYGAHGFEMINVTYSGDQLIAHKVTGDLNIPRGEISFTADLAPPPDAAPGAQRLAPIVLSEGSASKWGTPRLPRFPGRGHAAEPGFLNPQHVEGQLVVIGSEGDYFSFAWVPLEHQIFFGRPSPELTLRLLREGGGAGLTAGAGLGAPGEGAGARERRDYAARCARATDAAVLEDRDEGKQDAFSCIWHGDDEHCYFE